MSINYSKPHPPEGPVVEIDNATFEERHGYDAGIENVCFKVEQGDLVLILLEKGCVEHPLPDVVSGLQECTSGEVRVFGQSWKGLGPDKQSLARWRIGRVFSSHGWLSNLDIDENVTLSERHHSSRSSAEIDEEALKFARMVGLEHVPVDRPAAVDTIPLRKSEWVRAALGSPWLMLLEEPGRDMAADWLDDLLPLVNNVRENGTAVIWLCEDEEEWNNENLNPSLKLRAIGNTLTDVGRT